MLFFAYQHAMRMEAVHNPETLVRITAICSNRCAAVHVRVSVCVCAHCAYSRMIVIYYAQSVVMMIIKIASHKLHYILHLVDMVIAHICAVRKLSRERMLSVSQLIYGARRWHIKKCATRAIENIEVEEIK